MLEVMGIILLQLSERHTVKKPQTKPNQQIKNTTKTPGQTLESLESEQFPILLFSSGWTAQMLDTIHHGALHFASLQISGDQQSKMTVPFTVFMDYFKGPSLFIFKMIGVQLKCWTI